MPVAATQHAIGSTGWGGVAALGSRVFAVPYTAGTFAEVDPVAFTLSTFGSVGGTRAFLAPVAHAGAVFAPPHGASAAGAVRIDPAGPSAATFGPAGAPLGGRFTGLVPVGSDLIAVPYTDRHVGVIEAPSTWRWPTRPESVGDTFNRANGSIGSNWTALTGSAWTVASNAARPPSNEAHTVFRNGLWFSDVDVQANWSGSIGAQFFGVSARVTDANNLILAQFQASTGQITTYRRAAGTWTLIAGPTSGHTPGTLRLTITGSTITVYNNGALVHSVAVPSGTPEFGAVGMRSSNSTAPVVDWFTASGDAIDNLGTGDKWQGGDAWGGKVFCPPASAATTVLEIDAATGATAPFGSFAATAQTKWAGAKTVGNLIFCPPQIAASDVLVIDPASRTTSTISTPSHTTSTGWGMPCLGLDGLIYCPPYGSGSVLVIDPVALTTTTLGTGLSGSYVNFCGLLDGRLIAMPVSGNDLLEIHGIPLPRRGYRGIGLVRGSRG